MKFGRLGTMAVVGSAWCATGCVTYATVQSPAQIPTITAHVQVRGPQLANVPDVPSVVGGRVDGAAIHAALDQYGSWGDDPSYGAVWYPEAAPQGFVPYGTDGNWQLTDAGWYWQSQLPWGWLTFHYGRWVEVSARWAWVPGALFAPAWVDWRTTNGYVGWAPLPPEGAAYSAPYAFCPCEQMMSANVFSSCAYGASAIGYYAASVALPLSYGYGGALYGWGPPATMFGNVGGALPVAVPVAAAWRAGTGRSGGGAATPVMATAGTPVGASPQPRSGSPTMGASPTSGTRPSTPVMSPVTMPTALNVRPGSVPIGPAPIRAPAMVSGPVPMPPEPQHTRWVATVPTSAVYDSHSTFGRYRSADTVVISDQVPATRVSQTISLGTAGAGAYERAPSSFSGSYGSIPTSHGYAPSGGSYAPASTGYTAPAAGYNHPATTTYSSVPSYGGYHPSGGYTAPSVYSPSAPAHYSAPATTYTGPATNYTAPSYTAPAAYSGPAYSAPSGGYRPSSFGGAAVGRFGGGRR